MSESLQLNDSSFEAEVKNQKGLTLVDFWAPWCGPCQMMTPVIEELTAHYAGKVKVAKLNIDENPKTAQEFQVMSIPTLIVFKDGAEAERIIGAQTKEALIEKLDALQG